jgi:hypothetical protein
LIKSKKTTETEGKSGKKDIERRPIIHNDRRAQEKNANKNKEKRNFINENEEGDNRT